MKHLIFDIETIGFNFEKLDQKSQEYITHFAKTTAEEDAAKERLALSPFTGEIVAIALLDYDTAKGGVYFQAPQSKDCRENTKKGIHYLPANEQGILKQFWQIVQKYDQVITFNGRSFDAPFIYIRSLVYGIKSTKNLVPNRYYSNEHLDLMDRLKFFGASRANFNFHLACRALGIKSPKDNGVTGLDVPELFKNKKYEKIARYCLDDVIATKELYEKWLRLGLD